MFTYTGKGGISALLTIFGPTTGLIVAALLWPTGPPGAVVLLFVAAGLTIAAGVNRSVGLACNTEDTPDGPVRHDRHTLDGLPMQDRTWIQLSWRGSSSRRSSGFASTGSWASSSPSCRSPG